MSTRTLLELQAAYADIYFCPQARFFSFTSEFFLDVKLQNWRDNIIYILLNKTSFIVLGQVSSDTCK